MKRISVLALALLATSGTAFASSDDAWAEFAKDVETKCLEAVKDQVKEPKIVVDPFGTESFGVALVAGASAYGPGDPVSFACVYDKQKQTVEINQGFAADQVKIDIP